MHSRTRIRTVETPSSPPCDRIRHSASGLTLRAPADDNIGMAVPRITSADLKRRIDADRAPATIHVPRQIAFDPFCSAPSGSGQPRSGGIALTRTATLAADFSGTIRE